MGHAVRRPRHSALRRVAGIALAAALATGSAPSAVATNPLDPPSRFTTAGGRADVVSRSESGTIAAAARDFPPGDAGYHTYAEIAAEVKAVAAAHPGIVRRFSIGKSYQGREIWAVEITSSDLEESAKPGILFDGGTHANEHLGPEAALAVMHWLVDGYGSDARISRLVRTRSVFIVFELNPDGNEYDISGGRYHQWRKNRQPTSASRSIGTDLNRNFGNHWGCCGKVSRNPASNFYRGPAAWSAPETAALRDFVASRRIDGRQQIRGYISFHTFGRRILWPYGWTTKTRTADMSVDDHAVMVALARRMADRNGYRATQASALYLQSGTATDWGYGRWKMFSYTIELGTWDYPGDERIAPEMARNRSAVLWFIDAMGCPYATIGKAAAYCS